MELGLSRGSFEFETISGQEKERNETEKKGKEEDSYLASFSFPCNPAEGLSSKFCTVICNVRCEITDIPTC